MRDVKEPKDDASARSNRIGPDDRRYRAVVDKRFNKRFSASPDYVRLAHSVDDVVSAVQDAVSEEQRLVVTSGGHCLEGFVSDPDVRVIVDVSPMKRVYYDRHMNAVAVEAGATVGETFRVLFDRWGVVVPLGEYPAIGMEHEHQNPFAGIVWHEQAVYDSLAKPPNSWDHATTFHNILEKLTPQQVQGSAWDPDSIMGRVALLPKEFRRTKEQPRAHLPAHHIGPLVDQQRQVAMALDPAREGVADDGLRGRAHNQRLL